MIQMLETIYFWDLQSITGKIDYNPLNNQFYWSVANAMFSSLKCFGAPRHQILHKSAPQSWIRDKSAWLKLTWFKSQKIEGAHLSQNFFLKGPVWAKS